MKLEIIFFTQRDDNADEYLAHSSLSILNGRGKSEDEAIQNHLDRFFTSSKSSEYEKMLSKVPGITMKHFTFRQVG